MLRELHRGNDAMGDQSRLLELLREDGYIFLRNVLAPETVAEARGRTIQALYDRGYVRDTGDLPLWLGAPFDELDEFAQGELRESGLAQWFISQPSVDTLYRGLFGESMQWLNAPLSVHRCTPPASDVEATSRATPDIFAGRHQDAHVNAGLELYTTWIPLINIHPEGGGLAIAPGMHKRGMLHDWAVPTYPIPKGVIPDSAWYSTTYAPGDVLIFDGLTPHTALPNRSRAIRLSMDLRIIPSWAKSPSVGKLVSSSTSSISIAPMGGSVLSVPFDENTMIFGLSRRLLGPEDVSAGSDLPVGTEVMVGIADGGTATVIRPAVIRHKRQQHSSARVPDHP